MKRSSLNILIQALGNYLLISGFLYCFTLLISDAQAEIRDFQTTRMKSTGGTGVGALLFESSAFVNPASLAFYNTSSIYYQKVNSTRMTERDEAISQNESKTTAAILTDAGASFKGSFSYIKQEQKQEQREQFNFSFASVLNEKSSLGAALHMKKDADWTSGTKKTDDYKQAIFGVTHILNENINFGISIIDPFRVIEEDSKIIFGMQYVYKDFVSFMADMGSDYKNDLEENYLLRGAIQLKFLDDFFLRFGTFNDKTKQERGNGIGVSWVTPKLSADIAQNSVKKTGNLEDLKSDKLEEFTFSLSLRF